MHIDVIYALPSQQVVRRVDLREGATAEVAVINSRLAEDFPEIRVEGNQLSCYGRLIGWQTRLHDGDRVEILRPLSVDPKDSRRRRAAVQAARKARPGRPK